MMSVRLLEFRRVLKDTGSIYLHCDQYACHFLKLVMDSIFGNHQFQNEIIWAYRTGGVSKSRFARKHDNIFFYTKTGKYTFNESKDKSYVSASSAGMKAYGHKGKEYMLLEDEGGVYRQVVMRDVWHIDATGTVSHERLGYPTQKPLELLRRIVAASSNEGDVVLDPFCGCATTCVAAQRLGRRWIGIDIEENAVNQVIERLSDDAGLFSDFVSLTEPPVRSDVHKAFGDVDVKGNLYKTQSGRCNGCATEMRILDLEIDHIVPRSKGGGDYVENYQLLCGNCNRVKGNRPMEYLRNKISQRERLLKQQVSFGF